MTFAERTSSHHAPPEVLAAVTAIQRRLTWPSLHWGVEDLHPDALPHIAAAALDSLVGCGCLTQPQRPLHDPSGCYCECVDSGADGCIHGADVVIPAALVMGEAGA